VRRLLAGVLAAVATLSGIGLAAVTLRAREEHFPLAPVSERLLYLRSGRTAERVALTFDNLAADIYWIRTIQHYGRDLKNRTRAGRFELLYPLLDLTTTLDKHFLIAYRFGAIFLALAPPDGPGRSDLAITLLSKGLAANPDSWQLAHDIAFTHYLYTGDYKAAAEWFEKAAGMPKAPAWIGPLAAVVVAQGGNRQAARQMLSELRTAPEEYIRRAADRTFAQLEALDRLDHLRSLIDQFRSRTGREPDDWADLVAAGLIPGLPLDPAGVPITYDRTTHAPVLGSDSPLLPFPPMLRPR
jgi:tetratricopeptide (TPR) repeat protein